MGRGPWGDTNVGVIRVVLREWSFPRGCSWTEHAGLSPVPFSVLPRVREMWEKQRPGRQVEEQAGWCLGGQGKDLRVKYCRAEGGSHP